MSTNQDTGQFEYYLSSLDELGEILIEADKIESVSSGILRLTLGTIMASSGTIFLLEQKSSEIRELSSIGLKNYSPCIALSESFMLNIKVYQYGHLDYDEPPDWIEGALKEYLIKSKIKTIVPLFHKNNLLGLLCIGEKFMSEQFSDIDYKILEIISNHLTKALYNYELIRDVEQKKKELNFSSSVEILLGKCTKF